MPENAAALVNAVVGWAGVGAGALLLSLNLVTFPDGPAYAGLFDAGPLLGVWFGIVFVLLLRRAEPIATRQETGSTAARRSR